MTPRVLFMTDRNDPLPKCFGENSGYGLTLDSPEFWATPEPCDWVIAWVDGQAWLEYVFAGPERSWFLGADPAEAMRRAAQLIAKWELAGTGCKPN